MESGSNFWMLWLIYLAASGVFFVVFWRLTLLIKARWLAYLLRATLLALALTPWYANQQTTVLAPALMVVMLDMITIGGGAAVRSLVPLVLALVLAWVIGGVLYLLSLRTSVKKHKKPEKLKKTAKTKSYVAFIKF